MAEYDLMETALLQFEASDFGGTATLGGATVPCSPGSMGIGSRLLEGGFSPNAEATVVIRKSQYATKPKVGMAITVTDGNGTAQRLKITDDGVRDCVFAWELTCDNVVQGA